MAQLDRNGKSTEIHRRALQETSHMDSSTVFALNDLDYLNPCHNVQKN